MLEEVSLQSGTLEKSSSFHFKRAQRALTKDGRNQRAVKTDGTPGISRWRERELKQAELVL